MDISQQLTVENKQILSQAQLQSLEILSMDAVELEAFLQEEYINNPLLECTSDSMEGSSYHIASLENMSYRKNRTNRDDEDLSDSLNAILAADSDYLKNYLLDQLNIQKYSDREWKLCSFLIGCLEDDGYFRMEDDTVMDLTGCSREELNRVLSDLRLLEPCGIFARDLEHCLLRQLEEMDLDTSPLKEIVLFHLQDIADGKISTISRKLSIPTSEVRKYISIIRGLNSKPLSGLRDAAPVYVIPDILFAKSSKGWDIQVKDGGFNHYHLNEYYLALMEETRDPELKEYFSKKLERCRFVLSCIERRQKTMQAIAKAILSRQEDFFCGKGRLKPMTMVNLADEIGIHQSTVGRAIRGKYIQSPSGTFLIKNLFSGKAASDSSKEGVTAAYIKGMIADIIEGEDKKKPYSDANIVQLLAKHGVTISRRAVAKYRDELWIKSSVDRKER